MAKEKNKGGRPTDYNNNLVADLCSRIAMGQSLRKVCKADDMPAISTVYTWFPEYPELVEQYARAKEDSADADQDKLDEIAEKVLVGEYEPQNARVAADIIKWSASKKKPKKYGDKSTTVHEGSIGLKELPDPELDRRIAQLEQACEQG